MVASVLLQLQHCKASATDRNSGSTVHYTHHLQVLQLQKSIAVPHENAPLAMTCLLRFKAAVRKDV